MSYQNQIHRPADGLRTAEVLLPAPETSPLAREIPRPSMAWMTEDFLAQGFWSHDAILLSSVKFLGRPASSVQTSAGCWDRLEAKDLCGFLSGGIMAIGLFTGHVSKGNAATMEKCLKLTREYVDWWIGRYPRHCRKDKESCDFREMGRSASNFLQDMFERTS